MPTEPLDFDRKFEAAFGRPRPEKPVFYGYDQGLRFAGSEGVAPTVRTPDAEDDPTDYSVQRLLAAMHRTSEILRAAFGQGAPVQVLVETAAPSDPPDDDPEFDALRRCGFVPPAEIEHGVAPLNEEWRIHRHAFEIRAGDTNTKALLWAANSSNLAVSPKGDARVFFVDFERRLMLHPYDDRGFDLVAMAADPIVPLYVKYKHWLLAYDRCRMDKRYAAPARG